MLFLALESEEYEKNLEVLGQSLSDDILLH